MKKKIFLVTVLFFVAVQSQAQLAIVDIIREGIKKVIIAVDLRVQRLQNETIWLQNAQKTLENQMSKLKFDEITGWVEKQRVLYADYFDELWRVKSTLATYQRVRSIVERQLQLVKEYKSAWSLFSQDKNFTPEELNAMLQIYTGMLEASVKNIDQLFVVIRSFTLQMTDGARLSMINQCGDSVEETLMDLRKFNDQNKMVSIQRAVEMGEIEYVRKLYGLHPY